MKRFFLLLGSSSSEQSEREQVAEAGKMHFVLFLIHTKLHSHITHAYSLATS
jgi:hypothetical protein